MSFVFKNCSIGDGAQFITVEAGASLTLNLGGGYRTNTTNSTNNSARCPLKLSHYKSELKAWAQRCSGAQAPEGYHTETWGGSPKVFDDGVAPSGLNKGDALFFWKGGVDDPKSHPVPQGFEAVYAMEGVFVVVPASDGNDVPDDAGNCPTTVNNAQVDTDLEAADELSGADASLEIPSEASQNFDPWDDDDEEDGEPTTGRLGDAEGDDDDDRDEDDEGLDF